jgi:hypothetical protein
VNRLDEQQRYVLAAAVASAVGLVLAAWIGWNIGGDTVVLWADDIGTAIAALAATVLCARAGARQEEARMRLFWWLFAAACAGWTLAEVVWGYYDLVLQREVPLPSWADLGYLGGPALAIAALLVHPAMHRSRVARTRSLLDSLIVAVALLFLSWTFVLGPLWESTDLSTLGGLVGFAYPFSDVVLVFFVVLVARRVTTEGRLALWCLLTGLLAMAVADSLYAYLTTVQSYEGGGLLDLGWIVAYLAFGVGAYCAHERGDLAELPAPAQPSLAPLVVPFLPVLLALTVIGVQSQVGERPGDTSLLMACALVLLGLARQAVLFYDLVRATGDGEGSFVTRLYAALSDTAPGSK